jgi:hypothetical protein
MDDCVVELFWLPVGAGTHLQRASLVAYGWCLALIQRRPRADFVHAALKVKLNDRCFTLELMPVPKRQQTEPLMTGAVGSPLAGRLRIFRYQLLCLESDHLPDEEWAIQSPIILSTERDIAERVLDSGRDVPPYTWGRRAPGTTEMWTSDSAVAWLLCQVGLDAAALNPPAGTQAPGWLAGTQLAHSS